MTSFSNLLETLSQDSTVKGRQFERVAQHLLIRAPLYASLFRKVFLWQEWPLRDGRDVGVDLVAELADGSGLCAVQAKAYDPRYSIKKEDIDSFISASPPDRFSQRLLIATTNRVGPNASRTLSQHTNTAILLRSHIDALALAWPLTYDELIDGVLPSGDLRLKPYSFQQQAVSKCALALQHGGRAQLIMPCGTGKTLMGYWAAEHLSANRVIYAAPALSLVRRTLTTWANQRVNMPPWLVVCSDDTVGHGITADRPTGGTAEHLYELSVPVTTDPHRIATFLDTHDTYWLFATYHSTPVIAEALARLSNPRFDLAICDEAHRLVGASMLTFGSALDDSRVPCNRRLFLTATPKTYRRTRGKRARSAGISSKDMTDQGLYGSVAHRLGLAEAIDNGWLSDYQILVLVASDTETAGQLAPSVRLIGSRGQHIGHRTVAVATATIKAIQATGARRLVSFHGSNLKARNFHDALVELWPNRPNSDDAHLIVRNVHGGLSAARREEILHGFEELGEANRMIVTNARCLGEGVDVPTLDAIIFADPKNSYVEIVQAIGRAIRRSNNKGIATVVVPVVIPEGAHQNPTDAVSASAFRFVWQVLSAIRSHDTRLGDDIDAYAREYAKTGAVRGLPNRLSLLNACNMPLDATAFLKAFSTRLYESVAVADMYGLAKAEKYAEQFGSLQSITKHTVIDDFELGWWIVRQRVAFRSKTISPDVQQRLDELGVVWDAHEHRWHAMYQRFCKWIAEDPKRTGADIPTRLIVDGKNVSAWLRVQRSLYRENVLPPDKARLLEAIGVEWSPHDARWQEAILACRKWNEGDRDLSSVVNDSVIDSYPLGVFVSHQRVFYKKGVLSPERIAELESLGMAWDKKDANWFAKYRACQHYIAHVGPISQVNANGPSYRGQAIGRWLHHQRQLHKKGLLEPARKRLLDEIGVVWKPGRAKARESRKSFEHVAWKAMLLLCEEYVATNDGCRLVATTVFRGKQIGGWLRNNLYALRKGKLEPERVKLLKAKLHLFAYRGGKPRHETD
jgi:superfamily II DNA or RNA helicase